MKEKELILLKKMEEFTKKMKKQLSDRHLCPYKLSLNAHFSPPNRIYLIVLQLSYPYKTNLTSSCISIDYKATLLLPEKVPPEVTGKFSQPKRDDNYRPF